MFSIITEDIIDFLYKKCLHCAKKYCNITIVLLKSTQYSAIAKW